MTVTIAELVDVTTSMKNRCAGLFETLGGWVVSTEDPATQQRFARAAHRHAWHAELWAARRPTVPLVAAEFGDGTVDAIADASDSRLPWYLGHISDLRSDLAALAARVDPVLDPSTARVIALIDADLADELA